MASLKALVPAALRPLARRAAARLRRLRPRQRLTAAQLERYPGLKCIVSYNEYGAYCIPLSSLHRVAASRVLGNDVYEPETLRFMRARCGTGDVVHAGTYFGDFLPALSSGCAPGAKVWAFEPNPENYRCARVTLELNGVSNVTLTNAGLGAEAELLGVLTADAQGLPLGGASRIVRDDDAARKNAETIRVVPIDEVVPAGRKVTIVQLDVEGHEQPALAGALATIRRCRPIIILEVLPESDLIDSVWFRKHVLALGYRKTGELHANSVFEVEDAAP